MSKNRHHTELHFAIIVSVSHGHGQVATIELTERKLINVINVNEVDGSALVPTVCVFVLNSVG